MTPEQLVEHNETVRSSVEDVARPSSRSPPT